MRPAHALDEFTHRLKPGGNLILTALFGSSFSLRLCAALGWPILNFAVTTSRPQTWCILVSSVWQPKSVQNS